MKKRILSALMALALALSLMPTAALAQGESSGEDENAPVAEVGGVQYTPAQFMDAIAAAAAAPGSTVKLLRDYTMDLGDQSLDLSGYRLIFDLGGKTLTINTTNAIAVKMLSNEDPGTEITVKNGTLAGTAGTYLIRAANTGKLTMENMTVHYNGSGAKAIYTGLSQGAELSDVEIEAPNSGCVEVTSNATFTNCTFTAKNTADGATDAYLYTAIAVSTGGEATVNSGTYKGLYALYVYNSGGSIDVKDGIFEGTTAALQSDTSASAFDNSLITVSGGSFTGQIQTGGSGGSYTNEIEISGGSYTVDPSDYLADDCQIKNDGQGGFDVEPAPAALITVLDTFQQPAGTANTLKEALEKINGNGTLIFQGNVEISEDIEIPSMCTIRLNGYDLTGDSAVTVNQSGLTIEGSGEVACNLNNSTTNAYNLLLNGGSYSGTINGPAQVNSGDVKFSADTYTSADDSLVMPSGYEAKEKNGWYAFEPITYKVTLNPMGGTISETFLEGSGWTVDQDSGIAELSHTYDPDTSVSVPNAEQITGPGDTVLSAWYSTEDYTGGTTVNSTSGKLSNYNLTSKAAEDHTLTLYAKWKVAPIVAYVCDGDTRVKGYSSLEKAVVAAQPGQTVEVFNNVTLQESLTIDKDITLDLGNKGISFETYKSLILKANVTILGDSPEKKGYIQSVSASAIQALTDGTAITMKNVNVGTQGSVAMQLGTGGNKNVKVDLTAENCKFQLSDSSNHMQSNGGLRVQSGGTVKLTNCEFINGDSKQGYALRIDNGPDSTVTIDDCLIDANTTGKTSGFYGYALNISGDSGNDMAGKVTVSNSTIQVRKYQGSAVYLQNVSASADVTLGEGNTVSGPVKLVTYNQPNYRLNITGGKFDNQDTLPFANTNSSLEPETVKDYLYVTGGYYQVDVTDYVAPGYLCGENTSGAETDYGFQVTSDPSAGGFYTEVDGQKTFHQTLEAAVEAGAGTVYVCRDYTLTAEDLPLLNTSAAALATDAATVTYDGTLKELLIAIPNAALAGVSLTTSDAALSDVRTAGGKLTGGSGTKEAVAACAGLLAEGYLIDASTGAMDDRYSIVLQDGTFVAKIGDMGYTGLDEAVAAASSNDTAENQVQDEIVLLQDWDEEVFVTLPYSAFTLNLNEKTITGGVSITVADSGLATVQADHADITLKNGTITVEGGFGVHTNGQLEDVTLTLENLTVTVTKGAAAYLAAGGSTTITGGSYTGEMGVQVCAGSLTITDAEMTATAQAAGDLTQAGSGLIPDGSAVSVVQRDGYEAIGTVTINSGTFTAQDGMEAVKAYGWKDNAESDWTEAAESVQVKGGTYSSSVLEFAENPYEVGGQSGYTYYPTAQAAVDAAQAGGGVIAAGDGQTVPAPARDGATITATPDTKVEAPEGYYLTQTTGADGNIVYTVHKRAEAEKPDRPSSSDDSSSSEPSYAPSMDVSDGGTVKITPRTPEEGDEVTITPDPDRGYEVGEVVVTDRDGDALRVTAERDGTYTFTQPRGRVTIEVTFVRAGTAVGGEFVDVPDTYWAYDEIMWAYENGYVNGTSATTFAPGASITRQQVWMILARMTGAAPADMAAARTWAMENGISDGSNPGAAVTRQQLVALLFRFAEDLGYANDRRADLSVYPDASAVAAYAVEPMQWSVANDVVGGTTQGTLNPTGTATRAQLAVILYRFWANL